MKIIGIIPARGGSKGVIKKNLRIVGGDPLIAYSILTAQNSKLLSHYVTTTDDEEIAEVARQYGSPVLMRPGELASDETPMVPVVWHALESVERDLGHQFDVIVLIQPTSPIRVGKDIDTVINMFKKDSQLESVISVCPMEDINPARMYQIDENGYMNSFWEEFETHNRQSLPQVYIRNGAIYAVRRSVLKDQGNLMSKHKKAYVMPRSHWATIDDERDFAIADLLVRLWKEGKL